MLQIGVVGWAEFKRGKGAGETFFVRDAKPDSRQMKETVEYRLEANCEVSVGTSLPANNKGLSTSEENSK